MTFGRAAMAGSSGALSTAVTWAPSCGQDPGPAAGGGAEVEAGVAGAGMGAVLGEGFPEFEVGAAGRAGAVFLEAAFAVGEGAGLDGAERSRSGASRVQAPRWAWGRVRGSGAGGL